MDKQPGLQARAAPDTTLQTLKVTNTLINKVSGSGVILIRAEIHHNSFGYMAESKFNLLKQSGNVLDHLSATSMEGGRGKGSRYQAWKSVLLSQLHFPLC